MTTATRPPKLVLNAQVVRRLRFNHGLSAAELARQIGRSAHYVYRLEAGAYTGSPRTLKAIADALDATVEEITTLRTAENAG